MEVHEMAAKLHQIFRVFIGDSAEEWRVQKCGSQFHTEMEWANHLLSTHKQSCYDPNCNGNNAPFSKKLKGILSSINSSKNQTTTLNPDPDYIPPHKHNLSVRNAANPSPNKSILSQLVTGSSYSNPPYFPLLQRDNRNLKSTNKTDATLHQLLTSGNATNRYQRNSNSQVKTKSKTGCKMKCAQQKATNTTKAIKKRNSRKIITPRRLLRTGLRDITRKSYEYDDVGGDHLGNWQSPDQNDLIPSYIPNSQNASPYHPSPTQPPNSAIINYEDSPRHPISDTPIKEEPSDIEMPYPTKELNYEANEPNYSPNTPLLQNGQEPSTDSPLDVKVKEEPQWEYETLTESQDEAEDNVPVPPPANHLPSQETQPMKKSLLYGVLTGNVASIPKAPTNRKRPLNIHSHPMEEVKKLLSEKSQYEHYTPSPTQTLGSFLSSDLNLPSVVSIQKNVEDASKNMNVGIDNDLDGENTPINSFGKGNVLNIATSNKSATWHETLPKIQPNDCPSSFDASTKQQDGISSGYVVNNNVETAYKEASDKIDRIAYQEANKLEGGGSMSGEDRASEPVKNEPFSVGYGHGNACSPICSSSDVYPVITFSNSSVVAANENVVTHESGSLSRLTGGNLTRSGDGVSRSQSGMMGSQLDNVKLTGGHSMLSGALSSSSSSSTLLARISKLSQALSRSESCESGSTQTVSRSGIGLSGLGNYVNTSGSCVRNILTNDSNMSSGNSADSKDIGSPGTSSAGIGSKQSRLNISGSNSVPSTSNVGIVQSLLHPSCSGEMKTSETALVLESRSTGIGSELESRSTGIGSTNENYQMNPSSLENDAREMIPEIKPDLDSQYECSVCGKTFNSEWNLTIHKTVHKKYVRSNWV